MPDIIGFELCVTEPVGSNPFFESEVERYISTYFSSTSSILEWGIWNWGMGINKSLQGKIRNRRGNIFDKLGGGNMPRNYKAVDYLKGGVVGQIKSIESANPRYIEKLVNEAYKKMIAAVKSDSRLISAKNAELKIIVPTGTNKSVIEIIERAGKKYMGNQAGIKINAPKIIRGIPGKVGTMLKGLGIAGGAFSVYLLHEDIEKGDFYSAIGSGTSGAAAMLELGAGVVGSTALAVSAAVVGAFAVGYMIGTIINDRFISDNDQYLFPRAFTRLDSHGFDKVKEYYLRTLRR